jgi:hypothetical protein
MAKVKCPQCRAVATLPDEFVGRKARCKSCQKVFTATPADSITATAPAENGGGVITVKARQVGARGAPPAPAAAPSRVGRTILWLVVAAAGLVLPVLCAGGVVGVLWYRGRGPSVSPDQLYAGIEIGSKGVKSVLLQVTPNPDDPDGDNAVYLLGDPQTIDTTLVAGLVEKNKFDDDALRDTVGAVDKLYRAARKQKVPEDHIHIVGGSSVFSGLRKKKGLPDAEKEAIVRKNKEVLGQAVQAKVGKPAQFIDAADEAELYFKGTVPRPHAEQSVVYDIGSGSTKGACQGAGSNVSSLELPYGTKTYAELVQKELKKTGGSFAAVAHRLSDAELRQPLRDQLGRKPLFRNRERVYLNGGIVWVMATYVHPEDRRPMVPLSLADVDTFVKMLERDKQSILDECVKKAAAKDRKEVEKEVKRAIDTFNPDEARAGAEVFRAVAAEGEFQGKKLYFARHGLYAWLLVYVNEKGAAQ